MKSILLATFIVCLNISPIANVLAESESGTLESVKIESVAFAVVIDNEKYDVYINNNRIEIQAGNVFYHYKYNSRDSSPQLDKISFWRDSHFLLYSLSATGVNYYGNDDEPDVPNREKSFQIWTKYMIKAKQIMAKLNLQIAFSKH
jgi:hypothetical protein